MKIMKTQLLLVQSIIGHVKEVGMNNQLDPLIELQKEFCLFKLDSKVRVGLLKEINLMKAGHQIDEISMYNKEDGKLLMKRFLETLSVAPVPKTLIEDFMNNPNSIAYGQSYSLDKYLVTFFYYSA